MSMAAQRHANLAVKALVGVVVLLASGAASATTTQAGSSVSSETQRLEATWGPHVVRTAEVLPDSQVILIGTRDPYLLNSANPRNWLGSRFPVILTYVHASGAGYQSPLDKCGFGAHMMSDGTEM